MSLKKKALKGVLWTGIEQFSVQGVNFIISIILARILLPAEFGLIAMIAILTGIGSVLIDSGLDSSLIRTQSPSQEDYSTIFFFNLTGSVVIYIILYVSAPFVSSFYNQDILTNIIRIYSIGFIINAFSQVQHTRLIKLMQFKTLFIIKLPSVLISGIVGIVMAYNGYGVWSLVYISITNAFLSTLQLWYYSKWMPSKVFKVAIFKHHFNYGYKLTLSGLLNTAFNNIYPIIIGKFFPPAQLGYFVRANSLKQLPVSNFAAVMDKVTFPLFSEIQGDRVRLKSTIKRVMQMSIFVIAPILLIMAAVAEPLFRFLLTDKWLPAVPYFQILCFSGVLFPIHSYNLTILNVLGRSDLFLKLEIIKKILQVVTVIISFQFGIYGLLWGMAILSIFVLMVNSYYSARLIDYSGFEQIKDIAPTIIIALVIGFCSWLIDNYFGSLQLSDLLRILVTGSVGMLSYMLLTKWFKISSFNEIKSIILKNEYY